MHIYTNWKKSITDNNADHNNKLEKLSTYVAICEQIGASLLAAAYRYCAEMDRRGWSADDCSSLSVDDQWCLKKSVSSAVPATITSTTSTVANSIDPLVNL